MTLDDYSGGVSATDPDWSRENKRGMWDPGRSLLKSLRGYEAARAARGVRGWIAARYWSRWHKLWSLLTQCEIHLGTRIGGGLLLTHPTGIIIHPGSVIGPNCLIFHQVTLAGRCTLGGHVDIGAGAKLIGPLRVGDHVRIGANAVVTSDVPSNCVVAGVPARIIARGEKPRGAAGIP